MLDHVESLARKELGHVGEGEHAGQCLGFVGHLLGHTLSYPIPLHFGINDDARLGNG